jgi:hypothetical protein
MATTSGAAPLVTKLAVEVQALAVGADSTIVARVPYAGKITGVTYAPIVAMTGAATNNRTHAVVNKGQSGSGTTSVASLSYGNGTDAAAFDEKTITLTTTAADKVVAAGDILAVSSTHVGTGIADPGGTMFIEISRD